MNVGSEDELAKNIFTDQDIGSSVEGVEKRHSLKENLPNFKTFETLGKFKSKEPNVNDKSKDFSFSVPEVLIEEQDEFLLSKMWLSFLVHMTFLSAYLFLALAAVTFSGSPYISWYAVVTPLAVSFILGNIVCFAEFYYPMKHDYSVNQWKYIALTFHLVVQAIMMVVSIYLIAWTLSDKSETGNWICCGCLLGVFFSWAFVFSLCCSSLLAPGSEIDYRTVIMFGIYIFCLMLTTALFTLKEKLVGTAVQQRTDKNDKTKCEAGK